MVAKMEPYSTHQPLLMYAMCKMQGCVLEIGAGWYSTPLISAYAAATGRLCVTVEDNKAWMEQFVPYCHNYHKIVHASYDHEPFLLPSGTLWDVIFIDNGPSSRRVKDILRYRDLGRVIVTHDLECNNYHWEQLDGKFKDGITDRRRDPWCAVFSNFLPVTCWLQEWEAGR